MTTNEWNVLKDKTTDTWLEVLWEDGDWCRASVKWDGCIHFNQYGNVPYSADPKRKDKSCCDDYIHICDIDEMIDKLQKLKSKAIEHFGKEWEKP